MEERGKQEFQLLGPLQQWPFLQALQLSGHHARVRPHIPLGVPLRVLLAGGHLARPRLGFGPGEDLRVGGAGDVGPAVHLKYVLRQSLSSVADLSGNFTSTLRKAASIELKSSRVGSAKLRL